MERKKGKEGNSWGVGEKRGGKGSGGKRSKQASAELQFKKKERKNSSLLSQSLCQ